MKKLLLLLFILPVLGFGQVQEKYVSLWEFEHKDQTVTPGTNSFIRIAHSNNFANNDTLRVYFYYYKCVKGICSNSNLELLTKISFEDINNLPKDGDNTVKIPFIISDVGDYNKLTLQYTFKHFNDPAAEFYIEEPLVSGIVNPINKDLPVEYFDLFGRKVEKTSQGFYIWRQGTESGKIYKTGN